MNSLLSWLGMGMSGGSSGMSGGSSGMSGGSSGMSGGSPDDYENTSSSTLSSTLTSSTLTETQTISTLSSTLTSSTLTETQTISTLTDALMTSTSAIANIALTDGSLSNVTSTTTSKSSSIPLNYILGATSILALSSIILYIILKRKDKKTNEEIFQSNFNVNDYLVPSPHYETPEEFGEYYDVGSSEPVSYDLADNDHNVSYDLADNIYYSNSI